MPRLKTLIREIHRRSLWQVLAIYVGAGWIAYEAVQGLTEGLGLPQWFPGFAVVLFIVLLPLVLATAIVQEGGPSLTRTDPTLLPIELDTSGAAEEEAARRSAAGRHRWFTWRNALGAGLLVFAIWGIVSAGWLLTAFPGLVVNAQASDFFDAEDRVIVADFENQTEQQALGLAIQTAVITDLDQSEYVNVVERNAMGEVLERMRLTDTVRIDADLAIEIARREGFPAVVAGEVTPLGSGYQLSARIIETATGEVAVRMLETAVDDAEVVPAVERLARLARRHLGESLPSIRRSESLPNVTTASLEALELYARSDEFSDRGDVFGAIAVLQEAVQLDTAFGSAYRALAIHHGNIGDPATAATYIDLAYRYSGRLVERERYLTGGGYHSYRGRLDSAAHYYRLLAELEPNNLAAVNNLGDIYERMGRYEEALRLYRRVIEISPTLVGHVNLGSAARSLGLHELTDSVRRGLEERFPNTWHAWRGNLLDAYYAGDTARVEEIAWSMAEGLDFPRSYGRWALAGLGAMRGQTTAALALADTAADLLRETRSPFFEYQVLRVGFLTAFAAGTPERLNPMLEEITDPASVGGAPRFHHSALAAFATAHALARDYDRAEHYLAQMDSLLEAEDFWPFGVGEQARAIIALHQDRPQDALAHLQRSRELDYGRLQREGLLLLGDTYAALGRPEEAAAQYDSLTSTYRLYFLDVGTYGPLLPLAHERLGSVYLAQGDTTRAAVHLAEFTTLWENADPELQPRVDAARRTLERLAGDVQ